MSQHCTRHSKLFTVIVVIVFLLSFTGCEKSVEPDNTGNLFITSNPAGANIFLGNTDRKLVTPEVLSNISAGNHNLTLKLEGYEDYTRTVQITAGETNRHKADLVSLYTKLIINSTPAGATISLDGLPTNLITPDTIDVIPNSYSILLTKQYYHDYTTTLHVKQGEWKTHDAQLSLICPGGIVGDTSLAPEIKFVGLNSGSGTIKGKANNIDASIVRVVLYAKTNMWYVQPLVADPWTDICADGSWSNWTHSWNKIVALLVDRRYKPVATTYSHPANATGVLAYVEF